MRSRGKKHSCPSHNAVDVWNPSRYNAELWNPSWCMIFQILMFHYSILNCALVTYCIDLKCWFSLHILSMWETICDARLSRMWLAWQNFCSFWQEYPILAWSRIPPPQKWKVGQILALLSFDHYRIPPHWNWGRSWHFEFWLLQNMPPPIEIGISWHLRVLTTTEYHSPWKLKFRQILALWVLSTTEFHPPPIEI